VSGDARAAREAETVGRARVQGRRNHPRPGTQVSQPVELPTNRPDGSTSPEPIDDIGHCSRRTRDRRFIQDHPRADTDHAGVEVPRGVSGVPKRQEQRGAVLVEMALVVTFLCLVVFGIISFGILLGYRQNLTQAATEAARAASVQQDPDDQKAAALAAATSALGELDHTCGTTPEAGLTCTVSDIFACPSDTTLACRTVTVTLDNGAHSVVPKVPLLSTFIPDQLHAKTTVIVPGSPP
jgi:Flp pilus assembly protein TadG